MENNKIYWLWLQQILGAGARTDEITAQFPSPEELYSLGEVEWKLSGVLTNKQIERMKATDLAKARETLEICKNNGWQIVTLDDECYPEKLKNLKNSPLVLFVDGDISEVKSHICVSIVGTRKASFQGTCLANRYAHALSLAGIYTVSGGALGIDSAAHMGSLEAQGKTFAVLGCGFGVKYLMENEDMRRRIAKNGALISEYPPFTPASMRSFPIRNRIISGLCQSTVVIEAGIKSGSLITANCAMDQGREVYALPGDVFNSSYAGANQLIKDGARPLFSIFDLIEEYSLRFPDKVKENNVNKALEFISGKRELTEEEKKRSPKTVIIKNNPPKQKSQAQANTQAQAQAKDEIEQTDFHVTKIVSIPKDLSDNAKKVYDAMDDEPMYTDQIAQKTGLAPWEVISSLTELEIRDLVCLCAGKRYKKSN